MRSIFPHKGSKEHKKNLRQNSYYNFKKLQIMDTFSQKAKTGNVRMFRNAKCKRKSVISLNHTKQPLEFWKEAQHRPLVKSIKYLY